MTNTNKPNQMKNFLISIFFLITFNSFSQCACVYRDCSGNLRCTIFSNCGGSINSCAQSYGQCGNNTCNPTCGNTVQPCQIYPGQGSCLINIMPNGACWYAGGQCNTEVVCQVALPVELIRFNVINLDNENIITWSTASENNSSHFVLFYSSDGETFIDMVYLPAQGNSTELSEYYVRHVDYVRKINYYKLIQVDINGYKTEYGPVSINNIENNNILKIVDLLGRPVDSNYRGMVIHILEDGSVVKSYQ